MTQGLYGEYNHTMDPKGRVSLPAGFRKALPERLVLVPGPQGQVNVFSEEDFSKWKNELMEEHGGYKVKSGASDTAKLRLFINSWAQGVDVDTAGRINVPKKLRERAGLKKNVVVVGDEDHACLWDADKWEEYMQNYDFSDICF